MLYTRSMPTKRTRAWKDAHYSVAVAAKKKRSARKKASTAIHADMAVSEIIALCPSAVDILTEYGLHCFNCSFNSLESLREGCLGHGMTEEDVANIVEMIVIKHS